LLALAACAAQDPNYRATGGYYRPDASIELTKRDYAECDYEAVKSCGGARLGFEQGWCEGTVRSKCMSLRGYKSR
jgi:hypothetical protein